MKPIYQPDVQLLMDSINNQILSVQRELTEEFERKMNNVQVIFKKLLQSFTERIYQLNMN